MKMDILTGSEKIVAKCSASFVLNLLPEITIEYLYRLEARKRNHHNLQPEAMVGWLFWV